MKTADRTHLKQFLTDTQSAYSYFDTLYILGLDGRLGLMTPLDHQYIGFIQKPFSIHELSRKIRDILNR
jgi:hypothetical protein